MNHNAIICRNKLELRKVVDLLLNMGYNIAVCQDIEEGNYFVFTNAISNNGVTNTILENWIASHDNYVVTPVSIDYTNCSYQRKNGGRTDEVIITNFDIGEKE